MYNAKIISLLLLLSNNLQNFLLNKSVNSGNDERYNNIQNVEFNEFNEPIEAIDNFYYDYLNITLLHNIRKHIINKNIIEELEKDDINIQKKLDIIEKYTDICKNQTRIREFDLFAGDLLANFYDV